MPAFSAAQEPGPLNFVWSEFVLVLIIFGILFYLVTKYVVPSFEKTFAARRNAIEGGIERAEKAQAEAQSVLIEYRHQLADARGEAAEIRENARAEAQRIVDDLRVQAQQEAARIVARGEQDLAGQRAAIVRELRGEIGTLAVELSEKIVHEQLRDDVRVRATIDAFLADLEAADTGGVDGAGAAGTSSTS